MDRWAWEKLGCFDVFIRKGQEFSAGMLRERIERFGTSVLLKSIGCNGTPDREETSCSFPATHPNAAP